MEKRVGLRIKNPARRPIKFKTRARFIYTALFKLRMIGAKKNAHRLLSPVGAMWKIREGLRLDPHFG
jgi:hypothetical protein